MASFKIKKLILKDKKTGTSVVGEIEVEGGKPITAVDSLPSATKEEFDKGKIYTQGELLQYISKVAISEPNISTIGSLTSTGQKMPIAVYNNDIYIFGNGTNSGVYANRNVYKFSTLNNTITDLGLVLPFAPQYGYAATIGDSIFVVCYNESNTRVVVQKYSPLTNEATEVIYSVKNNLQKYAGAVVGKYIYIFGGLISSTYQSTIFRIDTENNTFSQLSTTLPIATASMSAITVGEDIYLLGGRISTDRTNTIYKFNTTTNVITKLDTNLADAAEDMGAALIGTNIYLFGGFFAGSGRKTTIMSFNITSETSAKLTATIPTAVSGISAVSINDNVYLFGGYTGSANVNTINKAEFGFTYEYEEIATKDDLENLGITVIEKEFDTGTEDLIFTESFTEEEFNKIYNDKTPIVAKYSSVASYVFSVELTQTMGTTSLVSCYCNTMPNGASLALAIRNDDGVITYFFEEVPKSSGTEIKSITFSAPSTATQGTITSSDLATLQENDQNYIIFNDEIFRLNDKQHESGYLVYSHNGHDTTGCFFQKCITITISTLGWVLESQENASKTYVDEQITSAYGYNVSVDGETLVFETVGNALQGDY